VPGKGLDLPVGTPRADEKVVGEAGVLPDVECEMLNPSSPCEAGASKQCVRVVMTATLFLPTVQAVVVMYRSTSGGTSPLSDLPRRTFFRMERDEMSRTGRTGQNSRPPAGETIGTPGEI